MWTFIIPRNTLNFNDRTKIAIWMVVTSVRDLHFNQNVMALCEMLVNISRRLLSARIFYDILIFLELFWHLMKNWFLFRCPLWCLQYDYHRIGSGSAFDDFQPGGRQCCQYNQYSGYSTHSRCIRRVVQFLNTFHFRYYTSIMLLSSNKGNGNASSNPGNMNVFLGDLRH